VYFSNITKWAVYDCNYGNLFSFLEGKMNF